MPTRGLPANNLDYQPVWGEKRQRVHERTSTPERAENIFNAVNVTGLKVLDLGANLGYFCFEAVARGAKNAIGIEYDLMTHLKAVEMLAKYPDAKIDFVNSDLNNLMYLQNILTLHKPDIILILSVLHHLDHPDTVVEYCGIGAKTLVVEFQTGDHETNINNVRRNLDTRTSVKRLDNSWYKAGPNDDHAGYERTVAVFTDERVNRKAMIRHDNGNINRFETFPDGTVRKYFYEGKVNELMREYQWTHGTRPSLIAQGRAPLPDNARETIYAAVVYIASTGIIHCELEDNIIVNDGVATIIDYETAFMVNDDFVEFFNQKIRFNSSFGQRNEPKVYTNLETILSSDIIELDEIFKKLGLKPLTSQEIGRYFEALLSSGVAEDSRVKKIRATWEKVGRTGLEPAA